MKQPKFIVGEIAGWHTRGQDVSVRILKVKKGWFFYKYYCQWKESDYMYGQYMVFDYTGWKYQFNLFKI